jgi:hypothetical protein
VGKPGDVGLFSRNPPKFAWSGRTCPPKPLAKADHRQFRETQMRKWFKNADSDDITMLVSGAVAVLAFCTFVLVWFIEAPRPECGRNCSTDFSSVNR